MPKFLGFAVLFAAGLALAGALAAGGVADVTTTETVPVTTTVSETTTEPASTVVSTLEQTTTRRVVVGNTGTTAGSSSASNTPTWVWVVLGVLAAGVVGLIVALLTRHGGLSDVERQRRLDAAVASWSAQGWALDSQTAGSAILRRGPDLMVVSIDDKGLTNARPLAG